MELWTHGRNRWSHCNVAEEASEPKTGLDSQKGRDPGLGLVEDPKRNGASGRGTNSELRTADGKDGADPTAGGPRPPLAEIPT